jgi:hypothetical protein
MLFVIENAFFVVESEERFYDLIELYSIHWEKPVFILEEIPILPQLLLALVNLEEKYMAMVGNT